MTRGGLPHSDILGSKLVCSSPGLFAACHVLHRLLAPRHSPYTLSSLTIRNSKLTLTNRLHVDWSATVPCNTACPRAVRRRMNVVVGKNYRLQNIQLSKIRLAGNSAGNLLTSAARTRSATRAALRRSSRRRRCARDSRASFAHRNFFKERVLTTLARPKLRCRLRSYRLRAAFGWLASRSPSQAGEGWWRIPGSNR